MQDVSLSPTAPVKCLKGGCFCFYFLFPLLTLLSCSEKKPLTSFPISLPLGASFFLPQQPRRRRGGQCLLQHLRSAVSWNPHTVLTAQQPLALARLL